MNGNINDVNRMLDLDTNNTLNDVDYGKMATRAAEKGYLDIVVLMLSLGVDVDSYQWIMANAAYTGHINIVQLMLDRHHTQTQINMSMSHAAEKGHTDIVKLLLDYGADDYTYAIEAAAKEGYIDIVQLILSEIDTQDLHISMGEYDYAIINAASNGHINIVRLLMSRGVISDRAINIATEITLPKYLDIALLLLSPEDPTSIDNAFIEAASRGLDIIIVEFIARKGVSRKAIKSAIKSASKNKHYNIAHHLKRLL